MSVSRAARKPSSPPSTWRRSGGTGDTSTRIERTSGKKRGIIITPEDPVFLDVSDSLRGVVLGDRVDDVSAEAVRSVLPVGAKVFELTYNAGKFGYSIKDATVAP